MSGKPVIARHRRKNTHFGKWATYNCATTMAGNIHIAIGEVRTHLTLNST